MARAVAHAWPAGRWTPPVVAQWEGDLTKVGVPAAEEALRRLKVTMVDPPTWSQFIGEARRHEPTEQPRREPGLNLDGHKQAIAALRAQHKFLNK